MKKHTGTDRNNSLITTIVSYSNLCKGRGVKKNPYQTYLNHNQEEQLQTI